MNTFILFVFSTAGNWKEKIETKSCLDLQAPGKNTPTAHRIFEEVVNEICKQFYRGSDFSRLRKTFIGWWKRNIPSQAPSPTTGQ